MNKKIAFLLCVIGLLGLKLSAQDNNHFGVFAGGSINMMKIDQSLYYDDSKLSTSMIINPSTHDTTYITAFLPIDNASVKPNGGFMLGGFYEYKADENFALQFELLYNQHGYSIKGTVDKKNMSDDNYITNDYSASMKLSNFSATLLLKIYATDYISIDLGAQPSYCFRAIKSGKCGIEQFSTVYKDKEYNSLNFSAIGGVTGYWKNFFLTARYSFGFINVLNAKKPVILNDNPNEILYTYTNNLKSKTSSVQLTIGYKFK